MSDSAAAATATAAAIVAAAAAMSVAAVHDEQQLLLQEEERLLLAQNEQEYVDHQQQQHQQDEEDEEEANNNIAFYEDYAAAIIALDGEDLVAIPAPAPVPDPTAVAIAAVACSSSNHNSNSSSSSSNNTGCHGHATVATAKGNVSGGTGDAPGSGSGYHSLSHAGGYHSLSHAYQTYLSHDRAEQNHWDEVCRSYRSYATFAMLQWHNHQQRLHALPEEQRRFLPAALRQEDLSLEFQNRAALYKNAAIRNQFCLDCILRHAGQPHSQQVIKQQPNDNMNSLPLPPITDAQMSKVSSVLKSLARDWSTEGKAERDLAYQPILQAIQKYLPLPHHHHYNNQQQQQAQSSQAQSSLQPQPIRVCVPGAGVGRLACELAALGYNVQGNEFSLYMLLASDFILNGSVGVFNNNNNDIMDEDNKCFKPLQISPYLLESRNVHCMADVVRTVAIPDVDPFAMCSTAAAGADVAAAAATVTDSSSMSSSSGSSSAAASAATAAPSASGSSLQDFCMAAGEFVSIYSHEREREQWNAVVACFFLDATPSIIEYVQVIHQMLQPGGYFLNFGPLLWHWSGPAMCFQDKSVQDYQERYAYLDKKYLTSIDVTWEDMREIILNIGFEMVHEEVGKKALYTSDRRSMMNMNYRCVHFVARKKKTTTTDTTMTESSFSLNSCLVDIGIGAAAPIQPTLSSDAVDAAIAAAVAVAAADEYCRDEHFDDELNNIAIDDVDDLGHGSINHSPQGSGSGGDGVAATSIVDEGEDQLMGDDDTGMLSDDPEAVGSALLV